MAPLRAEVVNVFIAAVARVLRASVGEATMLTSLQVTSSMDPPPSIAVAIEVSGGLRGPVTWVFSPELAQLIAERMTMSEDVPAELVLAAVAELSNMVAGNATGPLEDAGYQVFIAPPVVYDAATRPDPSVDTLVATVASATGTVRVFLDLEVAA